MTTTARISDTAHELVKRRAAQTDRSQRELIDDAIYAQYGDPPSTDDLVAENNDLLRDIAQSLGLRENPQEVQLTNDRTGDSNNTTTGEADADTSINGDKSDVTATEPETDTDAEATEAAAVTDQILVSDGGVNSKPMNADCLKGKYQHTIEIPPEQPVNLSDADVVTETPDARLPILKGMANSECSDHLPDILLEQWMDDHFEVVDQTKQRYREKGIEAGMLLPAPALDPAFPVEGLYEYTMYRMGNTRGTTELKQRQQYPDIGTLFDRQTSIRPGEESELTSEFTITTWPDTGLWWLEQEAYELRMKRLVEAVYGRAMQKPRQYTPYLSYLVFEWLPQRDILDEDGVAEWTDRIAAAEFDAEIWWRTEWLEEHRQLRPE